VEKVGLCLQSEAEIGQGGGRLNISEAGCTRGLMQQVHGERRPTVAIDDMSEVEPAAGVTDEERRR